MAGIVVAGAPVSFGVFELTPVGDELMLPTADEMVEGLQNAGYRGIDSGPIGFLGRGEELRDRLARSGLELAGGWVELPFSDDKRFAAALPELDRALDFFREVMPMNPALAPKPTLADASDAGRRANPGGGGPFVLDQAGLHRFAANLTTAAARVRARGLEPTFHHHAGTYIETPQEIDALLELTDVGLTFDTGHLLIGGGSVLDGWRRWNSRINHLHVKDVRIDVLNAIVARNGPMLDIWTERAFVPLGDGDLDIRSFMDAVVADGYEGWLVIEQDVYPTQGDNLARIMQDQETNREALRRWVP